ncbi:HDOD domain-containing protein [Marinobacter nauticus]|uniref:HDOD domain-containing protein n=2 Tax=Marinobacteraceae TaxID=2887365 RepID=UPI001C939D45|nr:HDOD domain-containing protein [Marinobacter nauticus]MBY5937189.1 HDOD domain-containing protein [Marinobacter nauticus]MBY5954568.1 HDOD domain-containing protein [Marinobacter nauticus]MBY5962676.1 HDOD domain-containing protein [Marinobacter nauticus]MBY6008210.1 HDOD domain-containing protein [Marinobacter nauticus]MBY6101891.1 HDOD domain-containing protein [Marinobacter nauticus]
MNSTQAWVSYLSKVELPVLANTLRQINELTDSRNSTVNELANVILNDAQLTSQVLRLSNTVFYNQTRTQVSTVSRAITLIGFDAVKSMAISSLIVDSLLKRNDRPHLLRCLARAIHAAVQARCLMPKCTEHALEEVFIGALLMNIGELAFWSCETEQASGLVDAWSLGPFINEVVASGQANSMASSLVRNSVEMARLFEQGWSGAEMDKVLERLSQDLGETPAAIRDQLKVNAQEATKVASSLGIPQVAALMPGGNGGQAGAGLTAPAMDADLQLQILRDLTHTLAEKPDINEVCQLVIEGIHRAIGMQRVALLMSDRTGNDLIPRKVGGRGTEQWRELFIVHKDGTGSLGKLLPAGASGVFRPARGAEGVAFDRWLGKVPALVGTLTAKGRLVGMFYADNAAAAYVPSEQQLTAFAHFVQNAQLCLTLMATK